VLTETRLLLIELLSLQLALVLGLHILVLDLIDILGPGSGTGRSTDISTSVVDSVMIGSRAGSAQSSRPRRMTSLTDLDLLRRPIVFSMQMWVL
jgi:hypothetical protein